MEKIKSGTSVKMSIAIIEVKRIAGKTGFVILTEPTEHNPSGTWQFIDNEATGKHAASNLLVGVGILDADNMERTVLELRSLAALGASLKQPIKLAYEAIFGNAGETWISPRGGEVRTYAQTGWNCLVSGVVMSPITQDELAVVNREIALNQDIAKEMAKARLGSSNRRQGYAAQASPAPVIETPFDNSGTNTGKEPLEKTPTKEELEFVAADEAVKAKELSEQTA